MKQMLYRYITLILMITLFIFVSHPVLGEHKVNGKDQKGTQAEALSDSEGDVLNEARSKLENAFSSYRKGDIEATRYNLKMATEWLNKAAQESSTEKVREEARKLAAGISIFEENISHASGQHDNSLARFWHQATSIIKRETDQLVHSYVQSAIAEKILKSLLDAKMHLFTAEHDLFISHDEEDAIEEMDNVLYYLDKANRVDFPATQDKIVALSKDVQLLKESMNSQKRAWESGSIIHSLDKALDNLTEVEKIASPAVKLRIESLKIDVYALRIDVERSNIKNGYDSAMAQLKEIINAL